MPNSLTKLLASNKKRPDRLPQSRIVAKDDETTIYIYDAIVADDISAEWWGGVSAQSLVPQIRGIKGGTINLHINSPGGDVFAAQAICQAIRDTSAKVVAHIDGFAASAATVIATAADEIKISEGGMYMVHCGWTMAIGNSIEMRSTADLLDKVDATICAQYARKTGKSMEDVLTIMQAETWYTAEEAVAAGFIDAISISPKVKNTWNLSAYANAPESIKNIDAKKKKPMGPMKMEESSFLADMISHHSMAIDMSKALIQADPADELREFAENIIKAQAGEIEIMKLWQEVGTPQQDGGQVANLATEEHRERQQQRIRMLARTQVS